MQLWNAPVALVIPSAEEREGSSSHLLSGSFAVFAAQDDSRSVRREERRRARRTPDYGVKIVTCCVELFVTLKSAHSVDCRPPTRSTSTRTLVTELSVGKSVARSKIGR